MSDQLKPCPFCGENAKVIQMPATIAVPEDIKKRGHFIKITSPHRRLRRNLVGVYMTVRINYSIFFHYHPSPFLTKTTSILAQGEVFVNAFGNFIANL